MKLNYLLLDVFTRERFKGNPLAVVLKADGLLDDQMQAIAREFNLSETVLINRPQAERHSAAVRIFTPTVELPFAGHPTVGAAVVLGLQGRSTAVRLEEKVGVITCVIERIEKHIGQARFALPKLPEEVGKAPPPLAIAGTLGLDPDDLVAQLGHTGGVGGAEVTGSEYGASHTAWIGPANERAATSHQAANQRQVTVGGG